MSALAVIMALSVILWIFLDRVKKLWTNVSWGGWITTIIAVGCGLAISFGYNLDLLVALDVIADASIGGTIFAGLAIAGGSSIINEIIARIKGGSNSSEE